MHFFLSSADALKCYECTSSKHVHCTEIIDVSNTNLEPVDCSHIYDAKYCIKTTGIFNGEVGTTRFCSSQDLGQICDFQKRMGDVRDYRGCVYTCSTDECNSASSLSLHVAALLLLLITGLLMNQRL